MAVAAFAAGTGSHARARPVRVDLDVGHVFGAGVGREDTGSRKNMDAESATCRTGVLARLRHREMDLLASATRRPRPQACRGRS